MWIAPALLASVAGAGATAASASAVDAAKNVLFIAGALLRCVYAAVPKLPAPSGFMHSLTVTRMRTVLCSLRCKCAAVDDMRPSIGAFNFSMAHTPNMDKLAATGLVFKSAYVQYAFCAPSRNR